MKRFKDLEDYINAAIANARYEAIDNGNSVYVEIPGFPGVWASGPSREEATAELKKVLQGWIELQTERDQPLPAIQGIRPPHVSFA